MTVIDLSFSEFGTDNAALSKAPLVIIHGLFGSKRNWNAIGKRLGRTQPVYLVDLRNHGDSPWDEVHTYEALAADLATFIQTQITSSGQTPVILGHSMGGKAAMMLALSYPELVERLIVVDIAPAQSGGTLIEYIQTMSEVPLAAYTKRSEVEEALAEEIPEPAIRSFLAHNIRIDDGRLSWQINLAALDDNFDAIMGFPDIADRQSYKGETLFIAGAKSDYIQSHHQAEIIRLFPKADLTMIEDAGHWVHAEAPGPFVEVVQAFLEA